MSIVFVEITNLIILIHTRVSIEDSCLQTSSILSFKITRSKLKIIRYCEIHTCFELALDPKTHNSTKDRERALAH